MTWLRRHRWGLAALVAGLLLRLYFVTRQPHVEGDSLVYGDLAANLLKHRVYGVTEAMGIRSTLIRLPGYPLFVAACFALFGVGNYVSVLYAQLALDLATCCLLGALAGRLMGRRAGLAALWLAALCPFTADYVAAPLTETPSIFCAALAFFALERWSARLRAGAGWNGWLWVIALALVFADMLRPDRVLLTFAVVAGMVWLALKSNPEARGRAFGQVGLIVVLLLVPHAVWGARNWRVFHVVQPLAPKSAADPGEFISYGFDRWYRTWAVEFISTDNIYWNYDGSLMSVDDLPDRAFDSPEQRQRTAEIFDRYNKNSVATPEVDVEFAGLAAQRVAAHPLRYYVELPMLRVADMWLRPRTDMLPLAADWWRFGLHPRRTLVSTGYAALNVAYLLLAAVGLWRWRRQGWSGQRVLGLTMVGFVLLRSAMLLTVDNSEPRYTIDCFPVVIVLAAVTFWPD
jgi:hypothetical protein